MKSLKNDSGIVLFEDFSKFTAGSEETPDLTEISDIESGEIPASYTNIFGWYGAGIFQAGGTCFIDIVEYPSGDDDTGVLETPYLDLSDNGGKFTVKFRAKSKLAAGDNLSVFSINYAEDQYSVNRVSITNTWQEYTLTFNDGKDGNVIQFYTLNGTWLLDDVRVLQDVGSTTFPAPAANAASDITETTFVASWTPVDGATAYLLSVYYYDENTKSTRLKSINSTRNYFLKDEAVDVTSVKIEQLDKNQTYYYTVKATNGTDISAESNEVKVEKGSTEITAAKLLEPTDITDSGFTARWEAVPGASLYYIYLQETYTASSDGVYLVENEDFSKINFGTTANPTVGGMQEYLDTYTNNSGWEAIYPLFANGMIGLSNDLGMMPSALFTPRYDLSSNDGKFTVEIDATSSVEDVLTLAKECFETPHLEATDSYQISFDTQAKKIIIEFQHVNPNAVGGVDLLMTTTGSKTFIDNLKIKKALKQNDSFSYIFYGTVNKSGKSIESVPIEVTPRAGFTYSYRVVVLKTLEEAPYLDFLGYENKMDVPFQSSIHNTNVDNIKVYSENNELHVILDHNATIDVYSVAGNHVAKLNGVSGDNALLLDSKGVYLVKVDNKYVTKVIR